jgi:hypothetical protein
VAAWVNPVKRAVQVLERARAKSPTSPFMKRLEGSLVETPCLELKGLVELHELMRVKNSVYGEVA